MRLHVTTNISNASSIAMAIEQKNKIGGRKFEEGINGEGSNRHNEENYWKVHPELFRKKWIKDDRGRRTTATTSSSVALTLGNKMRCISEEHKKKEKANEKKNKQSKANKSAPSGVGEHPNLNYDRTKHITENKERRSKLECAQVLVQKLLSKNKNLVQKANLLNAELDQKSATTRSSVLVQPDDPIIKIFSAIDDITTH
ncbi:hypothetical protein Tco_0238251 [Tanacetum coccineum]